MGAGGRSCERLLRRRVAVGRRGARSRRGRIGCGRRAGCRCGCCRRGRRRACRSGRRGARGGRSSGILGRGALRGGERRSGGVIDLRNPGRGRRSCGGLRNLAVVRGVRVSHDRSFLSSSPPLIIRLSESSRKRARKIMRRARRSSACAGRRGEEARNGAPGGIRTHNHRIRSPVLYPLSHRGTQRTMRRTHYIASSRRAVARRARRVRAAEAVFRTLTWFRAARTRNAYAFRHRPMCIKRSIRCKREKGLRKAWNAPIVSTCVKRWVWPSRLRRQIVALEIEGSSPFTHPSFLHEKPLQSVSPTL